MLSSPSLPSVWGGDVVFSHGGILYPIKPRISARNPTSSGQVSQQVEELPGASDFHSFPTGHQIRNLYLFSFSLSPTVAK